MPAAQSAVVTGAARGIGRAVAERLVSRGYLVLVTDVDTAAARRTASDIGAVAGLAHDVREEADHAAVADAATEHGELAVWVNNAGVGHDGPLVDLTSQQVAALVDVNLCGVVWGMRTALARFGPAGGDVVNVASLSGLGPVPELSMYGATKAAVVSLTMSVSLEVPEGVRVHVVCPDGVDTAMVAAMTPGGSAKALVHSGGGLLSADDVADAAVGLVGSRRVVRTLPGWRGAAMRSGALVPSQSKAALDAFEAFGRRVIRRRSS